MQHALIGIEDDLGARRDRRADRGPAATSMGMPSVPARMATCEVGPPAASAMPPSLPASMSMSCEGVRSRASRMPPAESRSSAPARHRARRSTWRSRSSRSSTRSARRASPVAFRLSRTGAQARAPREARALAAPHGIAARHRRSRGSSSNSRCADMISRTVGAAVAASCDRRARTVSRARSNARCSASTPLPGFDDGRSRPPVDRTPGRRRCPRLAMTPRRLRRPAGAKPPRRPARPRAPPRLRDCGSPRRWPRFRPRPLARIRR